MREDPTPSQPCDKPREEWSLRAARFCEGKTRCKGSPGHTQSCMRAQTSACMRIGRRIRASMYMGRRSQPASQDPPDTQPDLRYGRVSHASSPALKQHTREVRRRGCAVDGIGVRDEGLLVAGRHGNGHVSKISFSVLKSRDHHACGAAVGRAVLGRLLHRPVPPDDAHRPPRLPLPSTKVGRIDSVCVTVAHITFPQQQRSAWFAIVCGIGAVICGTLYPAYFNAFREVYALDVCSR